jgi:beta-N-acetylhexosaminidase
VIAVAALGVGRAVVPEALHERASVALPAVPHSTSKLLGQRIMVGFPGTSAPRWLLRRIGRGEIGAVVLFSGNIGTRTQLTALTSSLQTAARHGGNPPVLIAVDQEGGEVKRLPDGPPTLSPPQIAATGKVSVAGSQGRATGRYLKGLGINMDLAPVLDVPTSHSAFIYQQGRAFSFDAGTVARYASAFMNGLQSSGVAATAKHFPGLGSAPITTDAQLQELHPTAAQRAAALTPYKAVIAAGIDAVMVSVAGFPAYDHSGTVAALSKPIVEGVLRNRLHFDGVTITDSLGAPTGHDETSAGVLAAEAGTDILLYTDSASRELAALESVLARGQLTHSAATGSYQRIVELKQTLSH